MKKPVKRPSAKKKPSAKKPSPREGFPIGARVLLDGRDEAIVKSFWPSGSVFHMYPHYVVDLVDGDRGVRVQIDRVGVERKPSRQQAWVKNPSASRLNPAAIFLAQAFEAAFFGPILELNTLQAVQSLARADGKSYEEVVEKLRTDPSYLSHFIHDVVSGHRELERALKALTGRGMDHWLGVVELFEDKWRRAASEKSSTAKASKALQAMAGTFQVGDTVKIKDPASIAQIATAVVGYVSDGRASLLDPFSLGVRTSRGLGIPFDRLEHVDATYKDFIGRFYAGTIRDIVDRAISQGITPEKAARRFTIFNRESQPAQQWLVLMARRAISSVRTSSPLGFDDWLNSRPSLHIASPLAFDVLAYLEGDAWAKRQKDLGAKLDNGFFLNQLVFNVLSQQGLVSADVPLSELDPSAGAILGSAGALYIVMPTGEIMLDASSINEDKLVLTMSMMAVANG